MSSVERFFLSDLYILSVQRSTIAKMFFRSNRPYFFHGPRSSVTPSLPHPVQTCHMCNYTVACVYTRNIACNDTVAYRAAIKLLLRKASLQPIQIHLKTRGGFPVQGQSSVQIYPALALDRKSKIRKPILNQFFRVYLFRVYLFRV